MNESNPKEDEKEATGSENYQSLLQSALKVTKHSNELPNSLDWDYYQSFPAFVLAMKHFGDRITHAMTKLYAHYGLTGKVRKLDVEEQIELVSDHNDILMERINNSLDEASGLKKQAETVVLEMMANKTSNINGSWNRSQSNHPTQFRLLTAKNILRPQLKFKDKINNKSGPFIPKIKEKPHALKPLAVLMELNEFGDEEFTHPYEFELERFSPDPAFLRVSKEALPFRKVDDTPLVVVDDEAGLKRLLADLATHTVIGVDLEAHSYRTFQGITCLMQISTDTTDYIVDTLELWDQLQCLNEVLCNPKIVKVFHGADNDIEWLQRDFGLYVVNLFDTFHAAKLLNFSQLSLAYLLRHYCQVVVDKKYQLADWRIRPLPQEMVNYAREDTHYLGYVYERLKQDLHAKGIHGNLLSAVWQQSRLTCLKRYRIARIGPESHLELYRLSKKIFNERQLYALKEIFAWRDRIAREEDESVGFVLPKHMMLQIADVLPREMQGILACCSPIPPLVRQHLLHLHDIILRAREMPMSSLQHVGQQLAIPKAILAPLEQDPEDPLHCVHDLTHSQDIRDDLPTLLEPANTRTFVEPMDETDGVFVMMKTQPRARVFAETNAKHIALVDVAFVSPYARYTRTRALVAREEELELGRIEKLRQHFLASVQSDQAEQGVNEGSGNVTAGAQSNEPTEPSQAAGSETTIGEPAKKNKKKKKKKLPPLSGIISKEKKNRKNRQKGSISEGNAKATAKTPTARQSAGTWSVGTSEPSTSSVAAAPGPRSTSGSRPLKKHRREQQSGDSSLKAPDKFAAFDYSQVDYRTFQDQGSLPDRGNRSRGRRRGDRRGKRGVGKSKVHRNESGKSMTFSSK